MRKHERIHFAQVELGKIDIDHGNRNGALTAAKMQVGEDGRFTPARDRFDPQRGQMLGAHEVAHEIRPPQPGLQGEENAMTSHAVGTFTRS